MGGQVDSFFIIGDYAGFVSLECILESDETEAINARASFAASQQSGAQRIPLDQ